MAFWNTLFGNKKAQAEMFAPPSSIESLRVQVFRDSYLPIRLVDRNVTAVRPLAPGLVQALVEDLGGGERVLAWDMVRMFGKTDDELFELGLEQAGLHDRNEDLASESIDGIQMLSCNGFFLSAKLLLSCRNPKLTKGALVAPVSWHHWCFHGIHNLTTPPHIMMMAFFAREISAKMKATDAERLATSVYWVKPGGRALERIEFEGDEPVLSLELATTLESFEP